MTEPFGSAEQLDELERLCDAATPGPWRQGNEEDYHVFCVGTGWATPDERVLLRMNVHFPYESDARFIAAARSAVPRLIGEVRRLSTKLVVAHVDIERLKHENASLKAELARVVLATEGK